MNLGRLFVIYKILSLKVNYTLWTQIASLILDHYIKSPEIVFRKTGLHAWNCAPAGIRTPNLLIRSQMLYPLSYGRNLMRWEV